MIELELLGPHGDGSQLVFTDKSGERYLIVVDDALKTAVRRSELKLESLPATGTTLRPRNIQQLLRAGMPAADIAAQYNTDIDRVNRFLAPIVAERNYVVSSALAAPVGGESDAPRLGELVVDRLATRGVDAHSLRWTALREGDEPWELHLTFVQAAKEMRASWQVSNEGKPIRALDDEARWLTETTTPAAPNVTSLPEPDTRSNTPGEPATGDDIDKILSNLAAQRGRRQAPREAAPEVLAEQPSEKKSALLRFPSAKPKPESLKPEPASTPDVNEAEPAEPANSKTESTEHEDSDTLPGFESVKREESEPSSKTERKSKRRSVPSWDEIVFGTRGD